MFAAPLPPLPFPQETGRFSNGPPVGAVMAFAGRIGVPQPATADPPTTFGAVPKAHETDPLEAFGWMLCDGRVLDKSQYPELFAVLGYQYGGQQDQFHIPDYRGYFLRGADCGSSNDPDVAERTPSSPDGNAQAVGSRQEDALQTHEHIYQTCQVPAQAGPQSPPAGGPEAKPTLTQGGPTSALVPPGNVKVSNSETRPKNIYVHYIIKFTYYQQGALRY